MKLLLLAVSLVGSIFFISCSKEKKATSTPLVFSSLTAAKDSVLVNDTLKVTAIATGENLTYSWQSTGNIIGMGSVGYFTICHSDVFTVSCTVTDAGANTATKTISVKSYLP